MELARDGGGSRGSVTHTVDDENRGSRGPIPAGFGLVFGAAIGVVLFALTDSPVWIALGSGLGLIFGAGIARRRK